MAYEAKDIQDWAARSGGEDVSTVESSLLPGEEEGEDEEVGAPVEASEALMEVSELLSGALAKALDAAQAFRDEGDEAQAKEVDDVIAQLETLVNTLGVSEEEEEGEEPSEAEDADEELMEVEGEGAPY